MSASTWCVVDGVIPLRRSPLGHIPKNTRSPSGSRGTKTSKQRLLPEPLSNNFAGRSTSPTGGFPKMRSWSLLKPTKTFRKLPGRDKVAFPSKFILVKAGGLTRSKGLRGANNTDRHQRSDVGITCMFRFSHGHLRASLIQKNPHKDGAIDDPLEVKFVESMDMLVPRPNAGFCSQRIATL